MAKPPPHDAVTTQSIDTPTPTIRAGITYLKTRIPKPIITSGGDVKEAGIIRPNIELK